MNKVDSVYTGRPELQEHWPELEKATMISKDHYCQLIVSRRSLERRDFKKGGLRGLVDSVTGEYFLLAPSGGVN